MSEVSGKYQVEENDADGIAMIGEGYEPSVIIEQAQTVLQRRNGKLEAIDRAAFVKISTAFKSELSAISGDALKVWLFIVLSINRKTDVANPGLRTISKAVNLAVNTVQKCLFELERAGLLTVYRGEKRYNLYEVPEYVSANRAEPTVSKRDTDLETVSNPDTSVSNSAETVSPSVILNQRNQRNQIGKRGDLVDGLLHFGKQAKERGEDKAEEVIQTLERGLRVNIPRSTKNQAVAKRIISDGRSVSQWLSWVVSDPWRAARLYLYADLERVWTEFPQAFETVSYNPQNLEIGF